MTHYFDYESILSEGELIGFWPYRKALVAPSIAMIDVAHDRDARFLYGVVEKCLGSWATAPARQNLTFIKKWNLENHGYRVRVDNHVCFLIQWNSIRFFFMYSDNHLFVGDRITVDRW